MHHSYKHGRDSRVSHMPAGIAKETMQACLVRGKAAMQLAEDVAQLDGLLAELTSTLSTGERGSLWDDLQQLARDAQADDATLDTIRPRLTKLATAATRTREAWRDIKDTMHSKAALVKVEMDRQKIARELADREEVMGSLEAIIMLAKRFIQSQADRSEFGRQILKLPCYADQPQESVPAVETSPPDARIDG